MTDWQTPAALAIVALTALVFVWRAVRRRSKQPGAGCGSGCGSACPVAPKPRLPK